MIMQSILRSRIERQAEAMAVIDIYNTDRKYAAILSDPPWPYGQLASRAMRGGLPYEPMTIDQIAALPVERLALADCELWLWTTGPFIHEALHIVDAWGFQYRTKRVWAKSKAGTGFWVRGQTEDILIASRGKPRGRVQARAGERGGGATLSSLLVARTRHQQHSRKPRESYEDFEAVSGEPRLELFARRARAGWDSWGHEAKEPDLELAEDFDEYIRRTR